MSDGKEWVHWVCFNAYFEDALAKYRAKTGYGSTYAILMALNEYWYQIGCMSEEGYHYNKEKYGLPLIAKLKRHEQTVNISNKANPDVQKSNIPIKKIIDYGKFSDDELLDVYRKAILSNDVVSPNLIQGEARKRGYRFKADENGNVQVVSLKGDKP
ncbi:MAG: hypothetical protein QXR42_09335 [Candidatus Bathyarchaeia archaeon]